MFLRNPVRRAAPLWLASIALMAAACSGSSATPPILFVTPTPGPSGTAAAATDTATATPAATDTPAPTPAPTPTPAPVACVASSVAITIKDAGGGIFWQGGSGHKLATFVLKNVGAVTCTVKAKNQTILLNGNDGAIILGAVPAASATLKVAPGGTLHADVQTGNLCDVTGIVAPVRVAFMILPGTGLVIAKPVSSSDTGAIPPCLGDPSVYSGSIDMQPWAP